MVGEEMAEEFTLASRCFLLILKIFKSIPKHSKGFCHPCFELHLNYTLRTVPANTKVFCRVFQDARKTDLSVGY